MGHHLYHDAHKTSGRQHIPKTFIVELFVRVIVLYIITLLYTLGGVAQR